MANPPEYRPLSLEYVVSHVTFKAQEMREIAGITVRQLSYWVECGHLSITEDEGRNHAFTIDHVYLAYLIRQGINAGLNLRKAVNEAKRYMRDHPMVEVEPIIVIKQEEHGTEMPVDKLLSQTLKTLGNVSDQLQGIRRDLIPLQVRK